ncbi:bifunctional riboflavin kinase/FAD synthetase [Sporosarcina thermotolerans]|uniref:Riboflavin biosynthesis protein n=1 Tax=Sporosarcina thermotolerans TaxID=633404 RepID=A0AAW9A5C8_9BACL|nr:bifunctional riboflavin kinase/FAD synthetase [Sporosarcina thermotolerans]MDW0115688.1 bifunctional riboflavin kinase/FAD synthetase [Sporosarcina thermotolerans]WHT47042.1 bifunctional riboflavin kinase/FAD synthetase [Sporosarcina thermotolerans]
MEIYHLQYPQHKTIDDIGPFSLAIGFFDGLHKGHQAVIEEAKKKAEQLGIKSAVMTFDPHPSHLFGDGENKVGYITQYPLKSQYIEEMGIDALFIVKFDQPLSSLSPEQFIEIFIKGLGVKHVTAGFDFTFGSKGAGTMAQMDALSNGDYSTSVIEKVTDSDEKVSSTLIRKLLSEGDVEKTATLLGRSFRTVGTVVDGEKRGRLLGFPTANVLPDDELIIPSNGVYAVKFSLADQIYDGVCNVGVKPTFHDPSVSKTSVEVHLLDFTGDLYGKEVSVDWIARIRDEKKFGSVDELVEQISMDKETAKELLGRNL